MGNILGLDLGTNSIGWAIIKTSSNLNFELLDKGVRIFQEGVKLESGKELSRAGERTAYRSARRIKFRRRLRKIETLSVLSQFGYCPELSDAELRDWRYKKNYPKNDAFRQWWLTDNEGDLAQKKFQKKNPYYFRNLAATQKLDMDIESNRFLIGRAFYHICQRRGFLSNRLDKNKESEGDMKQAINSLTDEMEDRTLGQYFYEKYQKGQKIRGHYTDRKRHYLEEFETICRVQNLPEDFIKVVHRAIFYQRPLKSQKGLVKKCVFEKKKSCCAISRPEFEEYRMLGFINSIKIQMPDEKEMRSLNRGERKSILPLFFRKSKDQFRFEDIAKKLAPKNQYAFCKGDKSGGDYLFNFPMNTTVSGCPVSSRFEELLGSNFMKISFAYLREDGRSSNFDIYDIWHVLATFDSTEHLQQFAEQKLQLDKGLAEKFSKINFRQGYASLSLKAIRNILPLLRDGMIYSHAVFLSNMKIVLGPAIWEDKDKRESIQNKVVAIIQKQNQQKKIAGLINSILSEPDNLKKKESDQWGYLLSEIKASIGKTSYAKMNEAERGALEKWALEKMRKMIVSSQPVAIDSIDDQIKNYLRETFNVSDKSLDKLYHPSSIGVYPPATEGENGNPLLPSPRINSIRNPMAMRALHQLRVVINELIREGKVCQDTRVHIEMARELNDANRRKGLQLWQKEKEKTHLEYSEKIKEHFKGAGINREPSRNEIMKYALWEDQGRLCIYTDKANNNIGIEDFLDNNPQYDIEHTFPKSRTLDDSMENKTLCEVDFNRKIKRNRIPAELDNHEDILERVKPWKEKYKALESQIENLRKKAKNTDDIGIRDWATQQRHKLTLERNYWKGKYHRFAMKKIPHGFKNSQIVDTGIITKYARLYLKTYFKNVDAIKGSLVSEFRKMWHIQPEDKKKERTNHIHHCIDAVTIACMTRNNRDRLAQYYARLESASNTSKTKPNVRYPWPDFVKSIHSIDKETLISHYTPNVFLRQTKRKVRVRNKIQRDKKGDPMFQQGSGPRGSLHKGTFLGAVEDITLNNNGLVETKIRYACRKPLMDLKDVQLKHIVDDRVRKIVEKARKKEKELNKEIIKQSGLVKTTDNSEKKRIEHELAILKKKKENLYTMPNKNGSPIPIKKVRIYTRITNPIGIKDQRDQSKKAHKRKYYAENDEYYLMAFYEGKIAKGKVVRDFELLNNFDAARRLKTFSPKEISGPASPAVPEAKCSGKTEIALKAILKKGQLVILKKKDSEDIFRLPPEELVKRLYKITSFEKDGRINFRHHQTAMMHSSKGDDKDQMTILKYMKINNLEPSQIDFDNPLPWLRLSRTNWEFAVEGVDFKLTPLGRLVQAGG